MNYRHAFHAGNFADLVKHAALTGVLARMKALGGPVSVLDTHAGAGVYDLAGDMAARSGEGAAASALMQDDEAPPVFDALKAAVRAINPAGSIRYYPGSPALAARLLEAGDRYAGCELRPDDHALLVQALKAAGGRAELRALKVDGYAEAAQRSDGRRLVLIDPPFERADEYDRIVQAVVAARRGRSAATVLIWLPIKDLDTLDRFLGRMEDAVGSLLVAEARLRPLDNPLTMNGTALALVGAPDGAAADIEAACTWVVSRLGEPGGKAAVWAAGA